jgi:N-acetylglucosaminyldiphosphoundecaprenol N-acetyl-beta-D-mannosaminyltransferase
MNDVPIKCVEVFGFRVFSDDLDKIPLRQRCATVSTISPNSYGIATRDAEFRQALAQADYLVLDGVYFALGSLLLDGRSIKPNQGPDVFFFFMRKLNALHGRVFFLGSSEDTLAKIRRRAAVDYPQLSVGCYSPPFKPQFDDADNRLMLERINAFEAGVVFVGMTAPKQEKWAHRHRDQLNARLVISIGAVFDWYAGNEKMVAPIWWKLRLGWLVRTIRRPEILRRYPSIFIFFWHLSLALVGIKRFQHGK